MPTWDDEPFLHLGSSRSIRYGRQGTGGITATTTGLAGQRHARSAKTSGHAQSAALPAGQQERGSLASSGDGHARPPEGGKDIVPMQNGKRTKPVGSRAGCHGRRTDLFPAIGGQDQGLGPYREGSRPMRLVVIR